MGDDKHKEHLESVADQRLKRQHDDTMRGVETWRSLDGVAANVVQHTQFELKLDNTR